MSSLSPDEEPPADAARRNVLGGEALSRSARSAAAIEADGNVQSFDTQNRNLQDGVNRCPKCGSTEVRLRPKSGQLICLFCRNEWTEERVEEAFGLGEGIRDLAGTVIASGARDIDADAADVMTLKCGGCGAEVVVNTADELASRCHWCHHNLSINEQVPNGAVPDAVLPFQLTREQAVERIRAFADGRRTFALPAFTREFTPENVLGVYLPYMVVDAKAKAELHGIGEIETSRWTEGSGKNQKTYYSADVYELARRLDFTVDDLTIESSTQRANMDTRVNTNNVINTILPFDTKNAVRWNASYLAGFSSEKRDTDVAALAPLLDEQLLSIARAQARETVGAYDRGVRWEREKIDVGGSRWVSMYLPVWLYSYFQEGKQMVHYIATNARTGETMGSIPIAMGKLWLATLAIGTMVEGLAGTIVAALWNSSDDGSIAALLAAGPLSAGAFWWFIYRRYRNTDKSHSFETETRIDAEPSVHEDRKVDEIRKTSDRNIRGDNTQDHRRRVQRMR